MTNKLPTAPLNVALGFVEAGLQNREDVHNGLAGLEDVQIHIEQKDIAIARLTQDLIVALDVLIERGAALGQEDAEYRAQWKALTGRDWWEQGCTGGPAIVWKVADDAGS